MLNVKETVNSSKPTIEFDEYIPFTVEFEAGSSPSPFYWRVGDGKSSLMEIGLNNHSGAVQSITLTSIKLENIIQADRTIPSNLPKVNGLPICDLSQWFTDCSDDFSGNFLDEFNLDIYLKIGKSAISILIAGADMAVRYIKNNSVWFGIDSNDMLVTIDITELSSSDIEIISTFEN